MVCDMFLIAATLALVYLQFATMWPGRVQMIMFAVDSPGYEVLNPILQTLYTSDVYVLSLLAVLLVILTLSKKTLAGWIWMVLSLLLVIWPIYVSSLYASVVTPAPGLILSIVVAVFIFLVGLFKQGELSKQTFEI